MECIVYTDKICKSDSTYTCIELRTYVSNEHQNKYNKDVLLKIASKRLQNFTNICDWI